MASENSSIIIQYASDLSVPILQTLLTSPSISSFKTSGIGTGQVGEVHRISLTYSSNSGTSPGGPQTAILKVASRNPRSRSSGLSLGIYKCETRFYRDLAPALTTENPRFGIHCIPYCYHSAFDPSTGAFDLLLEDAGPDAVVGDDIKGATRGQARLAFRELGKIHAALMTMMDQDSHRVAWLVPKEPRLNPTFFKQLFTGFKARYTPSIKPGHLDVCERLVASYGEYTEFITAPGNCRMGVVHGDYRMDNMLFSDAREDGKEPRLTVVDWQLATVGPLLLDAAYFIGAGLKVEDRRQWMEDLLQTYCDAMTEVAGAPTLTLEECKKDLRSQAFIGVTMAITSSMLVAQTERGDEMFMTILARSCELVLDLGSLDLLPPPRADLAPLHPELEDEQIHPPGPERDWNESWYFDFVDEAQGLAGWVRLGLTPNLSRNWYHAAITRAGQPTVLVNNPRAPSLLADLHLKTNDLEATHEVIEPLRKFHITLRGTGRSFAREVDSLKEMGDETSLELDLIYETDGIPYKYRLTTRYEIPCKVSGTVRVGHDGSNFQVTNVPGQRDHSFGVRDWWGMDWVWSSFHSEDGQHIHTTELRLPHAPPMGMGYIQQHDTSLEVDRVLGKEVLDDHKLTEEMQIVIAPVGDRDGFQATVYPQAHTPLKLISDDGRVSLFDRAWGKVYLADGRKAVGWFEWNRNEQ